MAVPKKKISKTRGRMRRAHQAVSIPSLAVCPNCQEPRLSHRMCPKCGWYKNREVVSMED